MKTVLKNLVRPLPAAIAMAVLITGEYHLDVWPRFWYCFSLTFIVCFFADQNGFQRGKWLAMERLLPLIKGDQKEAENGAEHR